MLNVRRYWHRLSYNFEEVSTPVNTIQNKITRIVAAFSMLMLLIDTCVCTVLSAYLYFSEKIVTLNKVYFTLLYFTHLSRDYLKTEFTNAYELNSLRPSDAYMRQ